MSESFSRKQIEVLCEPLLPFLFLVGTTGSGKTYIANIYFYYQVLKAPEGALIMASGNTSESLYDNVIMPLMKIDVYKSLEYKSVQGHQRIVCNRNGVNVVCVSANTDNAQDRIFGKNIWLWYADEIQKQPKSFIELAVSRCRHVVDDELVETYRMATLNPDEPNHIVKTQYIDRIGEMNGKVYTFDFRDNPKIADPEAHRNALASKMTGYLRDRLVYGKWSVPENSIVPEFTLYEADLIKSHERPEYFYINAALDPGYNNYNAYLVGYYDFKQGVYVVENELFMREANSKQIADAIVECEHSAFARPADDRVSDTDLILIADLNQLHGLQIHSTRKDNLMAQVNVIRLLCQNKKLKIHPRCISLVRQLRSGVWNKMRDSFGTDADGSHYDMLAVLVYWVRSIDTSHNPYPEIPSSQRNDEWMRVETPQKNITKSMRALEGAFAR